MIQIDKVTGIPNIPLVDPEKNKLEMKKAHPDFWDMYWYPINKIPNYNLFTLFAENGGSIQVKKDVWQTASVSDFLDSSLSFRVDPKSELAISLLNSVIKTPWSKDLVFFDYYTRKPVVYVQRNAWFDFVDGQSTSLVCPYTEQSFLDDGTLVLTEDPVCYLYVLLACRNEYKVFGEDVIKDLHLVNSKCMVDEFLWVEFPKDGTHGKFQGEAPYKYSKDKPSSNSPYLEYIKMEGHRKKMFCCESAGKLYGLSGMVSLDHSSFSI